MYGRWVKNDQRFKIWENSGKLLLKCSKANVWSGTEIKIIENSVYPLLMFIKTNIIFIIIKFNAKSPLNPSIKLAPFTMNKKHNKTNTVEKISYFRRVIRKGMSMFNSFIGRKFIIKASAKTIKKSLLDGLILIFKSSKNPIINIVVLTKTYSYKISEYKR